MVCDATSGAMTRYATFLKGLAPHRWPRWCCRL
jgi:hypothetical protein